MSAHTMRKATHPVAIIFELDRVIRDRDTGSASAIADNPNAAPGSLDTLARARHLFPGIDSRLLANPSTSAGTIEWLIVDQHVLDTMMSTNLSAQGLVSARPDLTARTLSAIWTTVGPAARRRATFGHNLHKPMPLAYAIEHHPNCPSDLASAVRGWRASRSTRSVAFHG